MRRDRAELAKQAIALLTSFEGTIGIYPGRRGRADRDRVGLRRTDRPGRPAHLARKQGPRRLPHPDGVGRRRRRNAGFSDGTPWLPVKDAQAAHNVAAQEADEASVLHHYRAVIAWRKSQAALLTGRTEFLDLAEPVLAFHRDTGDTRLTCVFNLSPGDIALRATGNTVLTGPTQNAALAGDRLTLGPNGYAYLVARDAETVGLTLLEKSDAASVAVEVRKRGSVSG